MDDVRKDGYYTVVVVHEDEEECITAMSIDGQLFTLVRVPSEYVKEVLINSRMDFDNAVPNTDNPKNSESTE